MDATMAYIVVLALTTFAGAGIHAIVPPVETKPKEILTKIVAGFFVGIILGGGLLSGMTFPIDNATFVGIIAVPAISMSYFALDIINRIVGAWKNYGTTTPPTTP